MGAGNFTALVINAAQLLEQQLPRRVDQTTVIVEVTTLHIQAYIGLACDMPVTAVVQCSNGHPQLSGTAQISALVAEVARGNLQLAGTRQRRVIVG